ncbi:MAG TPA: polysaccharide pyruvyl transferase family protein [Pyrinomonadaceae bacterium]|nr:polysaccharide pyruvyl transferase family protein [Pyrinomonadaceae bacterium]
MRRISQLGTFDVENFGDLLYPIVLGQLVTTPVDPYSFLPGDAPLGAGFQTQSITNLMASPEPSTLVIGGGDLLRTDADLIAKHYGRNSRTSAKSLRKSIGFRGYAGYVLRDKLSRLEPSDFYARNFRARWMNYSAVGPFIIDPRDLPQGSVVAYVSCGVPHEFSTAEADDVKRALDAACRIWVRDEASAEKLRRTGVSQTVHVAPDMCVMLSHRISPEGLAGRGERTLSRFGINVRRPLLCFQSQPYPGFSEDEIVAQLNRYREKHRGDVVLLPLGYCHGDHEFLRRVSRKSNGALKYVDACSVVDMLSIIGAADLFAGTSLHGNITAFSFGIPHLFGPLPVAKAEGFLQVTNLPAELKLGSWRELNDRIDLALELGPQYFAAKAKEAKAAVKREVDQLRADLLKCTGA